MFSEQPFFLFLFQTPVVTKSTKNYINIFFPYNGIIFNKQKHEADGQSLFNTEKYF